MITRHVFPTKPPSVEYRMAPLGEAVLVPISALIDWANRHHDDIRKARDSFDRLEAA